MQKSIGKGEKVTRPKVQRAVEARLTNCSDECNKLRISISFNKSKQEQRIDSRLIHSQGLVGMTPLGKPSAVADGGTFNCEKATRPCNCPQGTEFGFVPCFAVSELRPKLAKGF
jgi:hypothetical protein